MKTKQDRRDALIEFDSPYCLDILRNRHFPSQVETYGVLSADGTHFATTDTPELKRLLLHKV